jgi:hypothetical protein
MAIKKTLFKIMGLALRLTVIRRRYNIGDKSNERQDAFLQFGMGILNKEVLRDEETPIFCIYSNPIHTFTGWLRCWH